jgi:hypothetical protein
MTTSQPAADDALTPVECERLRELLCALESHIQRSVVRAREEHSADALSEIVSVTSSDTIFRIDRLSEDAVGEWFEANWPGDWPVEIVMEGLADDELLVFPRGTTTSSLRFKCIIDPVDGTRSLMYDKRPAWVLAGVAPHRGEANRLSDIAVAAMTELPVSKQSRADQISAVRGAGRAGIVAERCNLETGETRSIAPRPSSATDLHHGFASIARFFPQAKVMLAEFEQALFERLYGADEANELAIFDDQYICSGGQLYELLMGRDRMLGDLRPEALERLRHPAPLACHPYDVCTVLILHEAGCPILSPSGAPLDAPLDTTTSVSWIGFANEDLARHVWPAFEAVYREFFGRL